MTKHQPATPLPWEVNLPSNSIHGKIDLVTGALPRGLDAIYIVHACNSHQKLVEAVQLALSGLEDFGPNGVRAKVVELLREINQEIE